MPPLVIEHSATPPQGWDDFARAHGIFYHASEWVTLLSQCFRFRATFTVAREGNTIAGILPLLTTRSLLGTRRLVSLPFSYAAGPVALAPQIATALVDDTRALAASLGIRHVEIKQAGEHAAPATGFQR